MPRMPLLFVFLALFLALSAAPAAALSLQVVPSESSIGPPAGAPDSLSGSLEIAIGSLPVLATTTFDMLSVLVSSSGGLDIVLDPTVATPGAGVVNPAGAFLIPTLFLRIDDGSGPQDLAVLDVTGQLTFSAGGTAVTRLEMDPFEIDTGAGLSTVTLVATPEPTALVLLATGFAALAARGRRPGCA